MESGIVAIIILILLAGSALALLMRQGMVPWSVPLLRASGAGSTMSADELHANERGVAAALDAGAERGLPTPFAEVPSGVHTRGHERGEPLLPDPVRLDIAPAPALALSASVERIEERLESLQRALERQNAELDRLRSELLSRAAAEDGRREAALERLRADLLATITSGTDRPSRVRDRRTDVSADLYARLARLESALAAVTNPILLPGESYVPPDELLAESLIWENWNEVGERAFALADAYSAQRLSLSDEVRQEVGQFVTVVRLMLTESVYPNLQTDPDAAQQAALRTSLEQVSAELPKVRAALDRDYRDLPAS